MEDQKLLNEKSSTTNSIRLFVVFCIAPIFIFFASCSSQKKGFYYYLENVTDTTDKGAVKVFEPVIQKNDLLSVQVYSAATDPKVDALYNLSNTSTSTANNPALIGYLVDQSGNIEYPRV